MSEFDGKIYIIRNLVNGFVYIGQTIQDYKSYIKWNHINRLNSNKHKNNHLQNAWIKYGPKSFEHSLLYNNIRSYNLLDFYEYVLIRYYRAGGKVYNKKDGGNTTRYSKESILERVNSGSYKKTDEWRKKIGDANRGRDLSYMIERSVSVRKGKPLTEEHKKKCSFSLKKVFYLKNIKTGETLKFLGKVDVINHIKKLNCENNFGRMDKVNGDRLFRDGANKYFEIYE